MNRSDSKDVCGSVSRMFACDSLRSHTADWNHFLRVLLVFGCCVVSVFGLGLVLTAFPRSLMKQQLLCVYGVSLCGLINLS